MIDVEFFGLRAGMHHLVNVLFHVMNSILLFLLLKRMTGALWQSFFVVVLFALHPLHVESVAWISERKDVLSTFFLMLTLLSYNLYTARPDLRRYLPVMIFFALGLMAKPMLVTVPFALLLLDYWPLKRLRIRVPLLSAGSFVFLVLEKVPLFFLATLSSVITYMVQDRTGAVIDTELVPFALRIQNTLVSYVIYLGKMFWPLRLAVHYPYQGYIPGWQVAGSACIIAVITIFVIYMAKRNPYLPVGWFWYLGTLVPVIGLVQVGGQAMADRYTYIPLIGLWIMFTWGVSEIFLCRRYGKTFCVTVAVIIIILLAGVTNRQVRYWQNSVTLFQHSLEVAPGDYLSEHNLGVALATKSRIDEAEKHFMEAIRLNPDYGNPYFCLGIVMQSRGKTEEAKKYFMEALERDPNMAEALNGLGTIAVSEGDIPEAIVLYRKSLEIRPEQADTHDNLGIALAEQGRIDEALKHFRQAVTLVPDNASFRNNLETALIKAERIDEVICMIEDRIGKDPENAELYVKRGILYTKKGMAAQAAASFHRALVLNPDSIEALHNLSILYTVAGRYEKALEFLMYLEEIDPGNADRARRIARLLALKGKEEESLAWLKKALERGYQYRENIENDSAFNKIKELREYRAIINAQYANSPSDE
ncbi:MAG: tetratricopeptide repeat protein [Deltaproteobacteria bacterium]|nr:tetratricopeptide repeat protein [Deltaproteobacteria bacterium]